MGLDMYFYAERQKYDYASLHEGNDVEYPDGLRKLGEYVDDRDFKSKTVTERYKIGYFRKFNALHNYLVEKLAGGVDDCNPIEIDKEDLEEILSVCEAVQADHSKAEELLPAEEGFFFGSTDYDDWYFEDVEEAVKFLKEALGEIDFAEWRVVYCASW